MCDDAGGAGGGAGAPRVAVAFADDTLRHVAYVMAESGRTELPVVERAQPDVPVGTVTSSSCCRGDCAT